MVGFVRRMRELIGFFSPLQPPPHMMNGPMGSGGGPGPYGPPGQGMGPPNMNNVSETRLVIQNQFIELAKLLTCY